MASYSKWERGRGNGDGGEGRRKEGSQGPRPQGRPAGEGDDPQQLLLSSIASGDIETVLRLLEGAEGLGLDLDRRDVGHDLQTPLMRLCHVSAPSPSSSSSGHHPSSLRHHEEEAVEASEEDDAGKDHLEKLLEPVLKRLQRCAWNPNVRDSTGRTLLMHACLAGRLDVALLCLDNGCDAHLLDVDGNSALVYVVRGGCLELLDFFLETETCRTLLNKANYLGQTPLDVARQLGRDSMVTALLESSSPGKSAEDDLVSSRDRAPRGGPGNHRGANVPNTIATADPYHPPFPLTPRSHNLEAAGENQAGLRRAASDRTLAAARKKKKDEVEGRDAEVGLRTSPEMARRSRKQQQPPPHHPHSMADLSSLVSSRNSSRYSTLVVTGSGSSSGSETRFLADSDSASAENEPPTSTGDNAALGSRTGRQKSRDAAEGGATTTRDPSPRRKAAKKPERRLRREAAEGEVEHSRSPERYPGQGPAGLVGMEGLEMRKASKPRSKQLQRCRKDSASLPDLRDLKGKLVTSGEQGCPADLAASDRPQLPWPAKSTPRLKPEEGEGRRGRIGERSRDGNRDDCADDDEKASKNTYLERYKNGDLSASCSLPPLQGLSSPSDVERRKERQKLAHGARKSNSQEEVMLRSLIV